MGCSRGSAAAWRSAGAAAVALCLLPVVVPLVLLWLPLLCFSVAVVRFFRRRRRRMMRGSCSPPLEGEADGAGTHRVALLHKYLEDQMELVGAEAEAKAGDATAAVLPRKPWAP